MLTEDPAPFQSLLPPQGTLMGFDLGTRTLGVALSDVLRVIASPLVTLKRGNFASVVEALSVDVKKHAVCGFVIGLPLNMNASRGPRAQSARAFGQNIEKHFSLPVLLWDERWSTVAVTRTLVEAGRSRARRAELVDKLAAAYILQGALDRLKDIEP
jgi:putative Holliday junction resolvase